jgi:hypothetical protein
MTDKPRLIERALPLKQTSFASVHEKIIELDEIIIYGTDPYNADTDGDGRGDGEEVQAGT